MTRWKYSFRTRKTAKKHLKHANKETGKKNVVKKFDSRVGAYRIFSSRKEYEEFVKKKRK